MNGQIYLNIANVIGFFSYTLAALNCGVENIKLL